VLLTLKFAGAILTGVFGVFGLLVEFKDENGKVTRWGKIALCLIIFSALVASGSTAIEEVRRRDDAARQAKETLASAQRSEGMLQDIKRVLYPFKTVGLEYKIRVPNQSDLKTEYLDGFERNKGAYVKNLSLGIPVSGMNNYQTAAGKFQAFHFGKEFK